MSRSVSVAFALPRTVAMRERVRQLGGARKVGALLRRAAHACLEAERSADAQLSVTLLDDAGIAELNQRFLSHDGPTDVLSFPLWSENEPPVGDVYVGLEQALRQAAELNVTPIEELVRLVVHGTLHVLGYDHPDGAARLRSAMWRRQERIVGEVVAKV